MLKAVSEIIGCRVAADGLLFGRVRNLYFDSDSWQVRCLVVAIGARHNHDDLRLVTPGSIQGDTPHARVIQCRIAPREIQNLSPASSLKPVCKQYESFRFGSPAAGPCHLPGNPHLRSWNVVQRYAVAYEGEQVGAVSDLLAEDSDWRIRFLKISQTFAGKALHFHIAPVAVEAISFAQECVTLRTLQPVHLKEPESPQPVFKISAA